jgi:hypothetical protein
MQTLLMSERKDDRGLLTGGAEVVFGNFRYIVWFFVLNLLLGWFGVLTFAGQMHSTLDHSLYSDRLLHGFDVAAFIDMLARPEFGPLLPATEAASALVVVFFLATVIFLPGVFQGYASTYRLPRDEFCRACGRNLWRFIRLLIVAGLVMGIIAGLLFAAHGWLVKQAGDSTNELLPFETKIATLATIFLVMTTLRIWFDLAEADVVLSDQSAVRKSIAAGFRHTWRSLGRLLTIYVVITIVAAIFLVGGLWAWMRFVPPDNLLRAFVVSQLTLLLLLIPRFWQRGIAVVYWQQKMLVPVVAVEPFMPESSPISVAAEPAPPPVLPIAPPAPES